MRGGKISEFLYILFTDRIYKSFVRLRFTRFTRVKRLMQSAERKHDAQS